MRGRRRGLWPAQGRLAAGASHADRAGGAVQLPHRMPVAAALVLQRLEERGDGALIPGCIALVSALALRRA